MQVAQFLEAHPGIEQVSYPGLKSHPQHELARSQMHDFGTLLSIRLQGDGSNARKFSEALQLFAISASLGSTESLVQPGELMRPRDLNEQERGSKVRLKPRSWSYQSAMLSQVEGTNLMACQIGCQHPEMGGREILFSSLLAPVASTISLVSLLEFYRFLARHQGAQIFSSRFRPPVETTGIEPATPALQRQCSPN